MSPMKDALERWSRLEPDRCEGVHNYFVMTSVGWQQYDRLPGILLAATIEAIEARGGWTWSLRSPHNGEPRYVGLVYYADRKWKARRADTPAEALLSAYLAALEAEGQ